MNEIKQISSGFVKKPIILKKYNPSLKNNIIAMVPVRAGSTRVPNKNTRKFANTSLLELKLKVLKNVSEITQIIVSTDCEIAGEIALSQNVKVQSRNKYFAGSQVTNDQHWLHIAQTTPGNIVFLAQVTSPLLRVSSIQKALNTFLNSDSNDSLN